MGHDHALIFQRNPIRDVKFPGFGVVETSDLLSQQIHHEGIEIEPFGYQAERFGALRLAVTLGRVFLVIHFANDIGANLIAGSQSFLERCEQLEPCDLADFLKHFFRRGGKLGLVYLRLKCRRRRSGSLLRSEGFSSRKPQSGQKQSSEETSNSFDRKKHNLCRIPDNDREWPRPEERGAGWEPCTFSNKGRSSVRVAASGVAARAPNWSNPAEAIRVVLHEQTGISACKFKLGPARIIHRKKITVPCSDSLTEW